MIKLDQMRDLVRDDVVGDTRRQLNQPPVKPDLAPVIAAPPLRTRVGKLDRRRRGLEATREMQRARDEQCQRLFLEPAADEGADFGLIAGRRMQNGEVQQIGGDSRSTRGEERQRQRPPQIEQRRTGVPFGRQ